MNCLLIFFSLFGTLIFAQCDATSELQCESNAACNWVENINYGNCSNLGSSSCDANPNCWGAYTNPGWYYGWYCAGGSYQIDNSYCTEDPTFELECTQMDQSECNNDASCEWIENIDYGSCSSLAWQVCESYVGCYVDSNPGWYDNSGPYCTGGSYQIDNSYCQEIEILECPEMNQIQCTQDSGCDWVQGFETASCYTVDSYLECSAINDCSWTTTQQACSGTGYEECVAQQGCSYSWLTYSCTGTTTTSYCTGGTYESPIYYCEEVSFLAGDINGDGILNISDIILIVNTILNLEYDEYSDVNQDGILNVIDVIMIVNKILGE